MTLKVRLFALGLVAAGLLSTAPADAARHHAASLAFPMKADEYRKLIDKRIGKVRDTIDKKLDRAGVSAERKTQIHRMIEDESKDIRAEVGKATVDGIVSQSEADAIKRLTNGLRARVRERMRLDKNPALKAKLDADKAKAEAEAQKTSKAKADAAKAKAEAEKAEKADKAKAAKAPSKTSGPTKPAKAKTGKTPNRAKTEEGAAL